MIILLSEQSLSDSDLQYGALAISAFCTGKFGNYESRSFKRCTYWDQLKIGLIFNFYMYSKFYNYIYNFTYYIYIRFRNNKKAIDVDELNLSILKTNTAHIIYTSMESD